MGPPCEGARHQGVTRIVRFVVPFGFDGAADRVAREVSPGRGSITVENIPGSGGLQGVQRANALAAAGEPTLLLGTPTTHVLLPLQRGEQGTPSDAFLAVAGLGSAPNVLLVSARLGVRNVAGLIARANAEPLVYASAGAGQTIHLCTALFCREAAIAMTHRPYDAGSATAYADLEAGRVHVYFDNLLACRDAIDAGAVVPLAISADRRTRLLPEVPTLVECGFPEHSLDVWFGVFGAHLDAALARAMASCRDDAGLASRLGALGLSGGVTAGAELASVIDASRPRWRAALGAAWHLFRADTQALRAPRPSRRVRRP